MRAVSPASTIRASSWKSATSNVSFKSAESDLKRQLSKKMSQSKVGKSDKSQRKKKAKSKKSTVQFSRYIHRVLKSVAPNEGISKKSMSIMESFMLDVFDRITSQLHTLVRHERNGRKTIATKDIQAATKLVLPGELATHAVNNGIQAVQHYFANRQA